MDIPQSFLDMPRWWSDATGTRWLAELTCLVAEQCARWGVVVDGAPWHGSNALVVPVRGKGEQFALRMSPPGDDVELEARALRFWDGRGTVRLIDADPGRSATLLERLDGSRSLLQLPLDRAVPMLAELMVELAVPAPADVPGTSSIAADLVESFPLDWERCGRPTSAALLTRAIDAAQALAAATPDLLAVNGDLHFEQVLAATRARWLVVDPVLYRGDIEYDLARILWSRLDEMPTDADVVRYFGVVVATTGAPEGRARSWVVTRSMSYLLWGLTRGLTTDPARCRRLLSIFA